MIENTQDFDNNNGEEDTSFARAYVEGKLGGLAVTAGRYNAFLAMVTFMMLALTVLKFPMAIKLN